MIPHSRFDVTAADGEAARRVVESGHIAQGRVVERLERAMARRVGLRHAAATNSGSSALHLALLSLGVGKGDEVIAPTYTCTAVLNAIHYTGAVPVLADIDETYNLCPRDVARRVSRRTKAVIAVHMFGVPADVKPLLGSGIPVIEDCAHALGAELDGRPCGSFGRASVFSFYATKMIAGGEGGMVATNSRRILDEVRDLRAYDEREDYRVRFNYKMTEVTAALTLSQLSRLSAFVERRRQIAQRYDSRLRECDFPVSEGSRRGRPCFFRYVVDFGAPAVNVIRLFEREGVCARRPVYKPLHRYLGARTLAGADRAWRQAVSLPVYPSLTNEEVSRVCLAITRVCRRLGRKLS